MSLKLQDEHPQHFCGPICVRVNFSFGPMLCGSSNKLHGQGCEVIVHGISVLNLHAFAPASRQRSFAYALSDLNDQVIPQE